MRYIILLFVFIISACGFSPVYGTKSISSEMNAIEIGIIPNREGQIIRNHLIDRLYSGGYPANAQYTLSVSAVTETIVEIGIDKDDEASRAQLRQSATFTLLDKSTKKPVLRRTARATSGYNILAGQFTTFVTEADARNQALKAIADDIVIQLELYFNR